MIHAVENDNEDIVYTAGDVVPVILTIYKNDELYDMTGMQVDIDIVKKNGSLLRSLSSTGESPAIVIATSRLTILTAAFTIVGRYLYDIQITNGSYIETIVKGNWIVRNEVTT